VSHVMSMGRIKLRNGKQRSQWTDVQDLLLGIGDF